MMKSRSRFDTPNGSKYLQQLCKHFAHKVAVEYDNTRGKADLPPGPAMLLADETGLTMTVNAEDAQGLALAQHIFEAHLIRFAFREDLKSLTWNEV